MTEDAQGGEPLIFEECGETADGSRKLFTCSLCPETLDRPLMVKRNSKNESLHKHRRKKHRKCTDCQILAAHQDHQVGGHADRPFSFLPISRLDVNSSIIPAALDTSQLA